MKKAVAYYRISTLSQEGNTSIEDQRAKVEAFALSQDIEIVKEFQDTSSGGNTNRAGYQDSLDYIEENKIDCYIILKLDRVHRHQQNLLVFESNLRAINVNLVSVQELIDTSTAIGKLMFQTLGSFAEFERSSINERTRAGRHAKAKNKTNKSNVGGNIPLGYDKGYLINVEQNVIVKDIFSQFLKIKSLRKLAKYCDEMQYKSLRGVSFSTAVLSSMLKNRSYVGEYSYKSDKEKLDIITKDHHDCIINKVQFGKVQAMLKRNLRR